jgi:hypothetical protein
VSTDAGPSWPGCHGVRLAGEDFSVGTACGTPLLDATVAVRELPAPAGPELWRIHGEAETATGTRQVDRWLCRHPDAGLVVHASAGPAVAVDPATHAISIEAGDTHVSLQLLTSFAIPMLLNSNGVLVLHASACASDGGAVVVCGPSGAGKSSALIALLEHGWQTLSEDVCAIDLRADVAMAWPGPPWVRRRQGEPGPAGATRRFESPDKVAWDIGRWHAPSAVPVTRLVFLDVPGGSVPEERVLTQPAAVRALAGQAAWLLDPDEGPAQLFAGTLELTQRIPSTVLRFPRDPTWTAHLPRMLARHAV